MSSDPVLPFHFPKTAQVAMPIGGLGAGSICLNGIGGLVDYSIRHRPATTALPDNVSIMEAGFALLRIKGAQPVTRLVEGPLEPEKIYAQRLQAQGYRHGGHEGLPRFEKSTFRAGYPFGQVRFQDRKLPLEVDMLGYNPFIPLDAKNSGLPCAILEFTLRNPSPERVSFDFSYHLSHLARPPKVGWDSTRTRALPRRGVFYDNLEDAASEHYGSACLLAPKQKVRVKGMWMRGRFYDAISALWREVSTGTFTENAGHNGVDVLGRNGGSILWAGELEPGQSTVFPVILTWYFPNVHENHGRALPEGAESPEIAPWQPYYAGQWNDAQDVAEYVAKNYDFLRQRTVRFNQALFSSTLPPVVLDAVSSNLAILKSPTVLRQKNGNFWGWEGCRTTEGSCHGTCTHVWNYAQALPHLFPDLERTIREQELLRSLDEAGHMNFRAALPDGPVDHDKQAAADGQLGCVLKLYRDWQISGNTEWLSGLYPLARRSLEYCIRQWDPWERGAISEPHHNTYDIEFWGPDGMCTSIYVGALSAMARMAGALEVEEDVKRYAALAERAGDFMERELFNGEYFQQKIQYEGLRDTTFVESLSIQGAEFSEMAALLAREGPKYQYGAGCLSDGVIGAWMAAIYGVEIPLHPGKIRQSLRAIYQHNFRLDLSEHINCQRPGYAMGKEAGLLLCTWPQGGKPTLPFVYSDEVWTGIEYQVASHLIEEGMVEEGLVLVKAVRSRYRGDVRNPFNEYECGSYYARAMASFALLNSLSGFRYSAVDKALHFGPQLSRRPFRSFFSTATAWGTITLSNSRLTISIMEGSLSLKVIHLRMDGAALTFEVNCQASAEQALSLPLRDFRGTPALQGV